MVTISFPYERKKYKPAGRQLLGISDGDTPKIQMPIRMSNIDTPEKADYAGKPDKSQPKIERGLQRLQQNQFGLVTDDLIQYFTERVGENSAAQHIDGGNRATHALQTFHDERLLREDGSFRKLGVFPQGEAIDFFGRVLAYTAPWYTKTELQAGADRTTFNLNLLEQGWAAFFPFYPSLPKNSDFELAVNAAEYAWDNKLGVWDLYGETFLLAYEFRMLVKLGEKKEDKQETWKGTFYRHCFDLRSMEDKGLFGFVEIPPPYRLWVKTEDLNAAIVDLGV